MNHKKNNTVSSRNNSQPNRTNSIFWKAYNHILNGDTMLGEIVLLESIFQDTPAIEYRYLMAKFTGPWWQPFNCPIRHAGLGTFACRGNDKAIAKLYAKGEATGVQVAHALIECALDPKPNLAFKFSAQEKIALLQTYALEADVFCRSGHAFYPSLAWLNNRTRRAVRFFNAHAKLCSDDGIPTAATATASAVEAPLSPVVKWPDRLYDFHGISTPLAYTGS